MSTLLGEEYLTVAQAAAFLHVSQSTIWRWIEQQELPSYRVGHRRVWIKKADLERLITPARPSGNERGAAPVEVPLPPPLTGEGKREALAALEAAKRLRRQILAQRGGKLFPDSSELLREMREERDHPRG